MPSPPPPPLPAAFNPAITYFLGGWDLGICADLMLQGVLFAQIAHYTALYDTDVLVLRVFVAVLLIITTLKTAQGLTLLWILNVQHFMDVDAALSLFTTSWITSINLALIGVIALYVQLFFCARLWWISNNLYIVAVIVTLFIFALIAAYIFTFVGNSKNVTWFIIHLGSVFAGDVLLCGSTIYALLYHSRHVSAQTAGILSSLTKLAFQSAAPAVVCALITLVSTVAWDRTTPNGYMLLALVANHMLPKLYAISAMWTLNSRRSIRRAHSIGPRSSSPMGELQRSHNFELTSLGLSSNQHDSSETQMQSTTPLPVDDPGFAKSDTRSG
ncbi:hypothetical protein GGX14DRAFT_573117 [Mycena pura]|uniref:DUF6534 domain-containing protein n=1 Tax=Mycena pura TaxID=153505 RepID=A0AAD6V3W4_9AGAR|nr:hypothetical protein GGX14DRAFT_573117 [Mycena pura]